MLFHTDTHGPDPDALKRALAKCVQLAPSSNNECKICVHTQGNWTINTFIEAFGDPFVKAMLNGSFTHGNLTIHLETEHNKIARPMAAFAPFVNLEYLNDIIKRNSGSDVVYVPWMEKELKDYTAAYTSTAI